MRRLCASSFLSAIILALSSTAAAQVYASISVGRSDFNYPSGSGTSLNLNVGGYFAPNLAVDFDYVDLGSVDLSDGSSLDYGGYNVAAKAVVPLNPDVEVYARLGMFVWEVQQSAPAFTSTVDDGINLSYGVGGGYSFQNHLGVFVEFNGYNMGVYDVTSLSIGGRFSF